MLVRISTDFNTEDASFVSKLPFTTGGNISGEQITIKRSKGGVDGILKKLKEWVVGESSYLVLDVIPYALIQPYIQQNTEAKVS